MQLFQVSSEVIKLANGLLELDKPFKLFDMKKFQQNVNRELKRQTPERLRLEVQVQINSQVFAVHIHHLLCEAGEGGAGLPHMDHAHQRGGAGNAEGKNAWKNW